MARILITGGAGYIGSHCAKALAEIGHDVVVFDSLLFGHREFLRWGVFVHGDIRDASALNSVFDAHRIDAVIHFAALAYVGQSVTEPGRYYDVNVNGTRVLLDAMQRAGIGKIVFSSSCAVYGQPASSPITEAIEPRPINPYGQTKLICERMIGDFGHAHGLQSVCLRYFNAAGADPGGQIGEDHSPETHLIPLVLEAAFGRRAAVSKFGADYDTPDGSAIRDYIHVCDLASAHAAALGHLLDGGETCQINLGTGAGSSVKDVIECARRVTGRPITVRDEPRRQGDPAALVADAGLARQKLNWSPVRSDLQTVISDAWRWHQRRWER